MAASHIFWRKAAKYKYELVGWEKKVIRVTDKEHWDGEHKQKIASNEASSSAGPEIHCR